jgi:hypothetical protein
MNKLKKYFTDNSVAYGYFFYVQVSMFAVRTYYKFETTQPHAISKQLLYIWQAGLILPYLIPLVFLIAGFLTFDYSSVKEDKISMISLNIFIALIIFFYALVGY